MWRTGGDRASNRTLSRTSHGRRLGRAAALSLLLFAARASALVETQLTQEGQSGFQQLVASVRKGALGPGFADASFVPTHRGLSWDGAVRLDLRRSDGTTTGMILLRPENAREGNVPRWFIPFPDLNLSPAEGRETSTLLDRTFPADPWTRPATSIPQGTSIVGLRRVLFALWFIVVTTVLGLLFLVFLRPRSDDEHLAP